MRCWRRAAAVITLGALLAMHALDAHAVAAHEPGAASEPPLHAMTPTASTAHASQRGGEHVAALCVAMLLAASIALVRRSGVRLHSVAPATRRWISDVLVVARAQVRPPPPAWLLVSVDRR